MPLLPREPQIVPDDIFNLSEPWRIAHVRSRQEKSLARFARQKGVPYYLPQVERVTDRGGRRYTSYLPLFPGYLFFRGDRHARDTLVRSDLAVAILEATDQETLGRELRQIRELQLAGASLTPVEVFGSGDVVRIAGGPFDGYQGVVERGSRGERLIVSISLLRKSVAVELDAAVLRRHERRG